MIGVTVLLHRGLAGCRPQEVGSRTERFSRVVTDTHTDWPQTDRPQTDIPSDYRPTDRQVDQPTDRPGQIDTEAVADRRR